MPVHFVWDVFSVIERGSGEMVAATIRTIFAQTTGEQVRTQPNVVADMPGRGGGATAEGELELGEAGARVIGLSGDRARRAIVPAG